MTTPIPILPYDKYIAKALELLDNLGEGGIENLQWAMSVLIYRLSKILCAPTAPAGPVRVKELLDDDLKECFVKYPDLQAHAPIFHQAIELLEQLLQYAGWYSVDRVLMRTFPNFTDHIAAHQNPAMAQTNKPYSSWGRPLPFRPLFCALGAFSLAFPVRGDARKYEDLPGEDGVFYQGGDDKPQVRLDRQRTFATLLDACDYQVALWKSFHKSEVAYAEDTTAYMSEPAQRPLRKGSSYWRKPKASISPDIVIVRRRLLRPDKNNVTHVVDMKFEGDDLKWQQGQNYVNMFGPERFYVLYFPGDCQVSEPEEVKAPEWVLVLMAVLMKILSRGRGGFRLPKPGFGPVPAPAF